MKIALKPRQQRADFARTAIQLRKQSGLVLVMTLIVLVAMTLASAALVRSIDTSTLIAGNLAFKQSAIASGEAGVNKAITWLTENSGSLTADVTSSGYYATNQECVDLTGNGNVPNNCPLPIESLNWNEADKVNVLGEDSAGNDVSYVIHRLCTSPGPLDGATCPIVQSKPAGSSMGGTRPMGGYQPRSWESDTNRGYYRITVRVAGPRNSVNYVQTIISI